MNDPLLEALKKDNTFLRMMTKYRRAESVKAALYECRPVNIYAGIEGASVAGIQVVSRTSAEKPLKTMGVRDENIKHFADLDHKEISKPASKSDPLYTWVLSIVRFELNRVRRAPDKCLCEQPRSSRWGVPATACTR